MIDLQMYSTYFYCTDSVIDIFKSKKIDIYFECRS